jgi:hypothetical protein
LDSPFAGQFKQPELISTDNILPLIIRGTLPAANPPQFHDAHAFWTNFQLIEMRQVRDFSGLDTRVMDSKITRRVLNHPQAWGMIKCFATVEIWLANRATLDGGY